MPFDAFISYASEDRSIAEAIRVALHGTGIRCGLDEDGRSPDSNASGARLISQSHAFILVLTPESNSSAAITQELHLAAQSKRVIIPLRIGDVVPEPGKQFYIGRTQWLELSNPPNSEQIQRLGERIQATRTQVKRDQILGAAPLATRKDRSLSWLHFLPSVFSCLLFSLRSSRPSPRLR